MSTDILTQLQTTYTQLLTQFFSSLSYLSQRHPLLAPEPRAGDPYTSISTAPTEPGPEDADSNRQPYPLRPDSPRTFEIGQKELAEDLVLKSQQIQFLIERLPGLGKGEEEQAEAIKILVGQVEEMENMRRVKRKEMRDLVRRLQDVVGGMSTSIDSETSDRSTL